MKIPQITSITIIHPQRYVLTDDDFQAEQDEDTALAPAVHLNLTNHGKNVQIYNRGLCIKRVASYNQALVVSAQPLPRNQMFKIRIDKLNPRWSSSLLFGLLGFCPEKYTMPVSALNIKKPAWIVYGDSVFHSGVKVSIHGPPVVCSHLLVRINEAFEGVLNCDLQMKVQYHWNFFDTQSMLFW